MKKMSKKATALAGLGVLAVVGGTFAYYNQTVSLENPLTTGKYENELIEDYTPPTEELKPGATLDKVVVAKNTGDYPVMVRIRMDEVWRRKGDNNVPEDFISHGSTEEDGFAAIEIGTKDGYGNEFDADQVDDDDGLVNGDKSVVRKNLAAGFAEDWTYNANDGYWYYNKILAPGQTADNFLESITLASDIDLGHYIEQNWYFIGDASTDKENISGWIEYDMTDYSDRNGDNLVDAIDMAISLGITDEQKLFRKNESLLDSTHPGYSDANYTLTVTSEFVQATPGALNEAFGDFEKLPANIKDTIEKIDMDDLDLNRQGTAGSQGNDGE